MKTWSYFQCVVCQEEFDLVCGILWEVGTLGLEEEPLPSGRQRIRAYFDQEDGIHSLADEFLAACQQAGLHLSSFSVKNRKEQDWLKNWRKGLKPFEVGTRMYVIPGTPGTGPMPEGRIPLFVEPGMAFGTGTHETTQLCLEGLEQLELTDKKVLDVGTGSGILAIAAVRLGCRKVFACDIDPEAIRVARSNSVINQCDREIEWIVGDIRRVKQRQFDLILANLTAEAIRQELSSLEERLAEGGIVFLSGILQSQAQQVRAALKPSRWKSIRQRRKADWAALKATRH